MNLSKEVINLSPEVRIAFLKWENPGAEYNKVALPEAVVDQIMDWQKAAFTQQETSSD